MEHPSCSEQRPKIFIGIHARSGAIGECLARVSGQGGWEYQLRLPDENLTPFYLLNEIQIAGPAEVAGFLGLRKLHEKTSKFFRPHE